MTRSMIEVVGLVAGCLVLALSPKISDALTNIIRWLNRRTLEETGPPSTFLRLWTSRHLGELQWIAYLTIFLFSVGVVATFRQSLPAKNIIPRSTTQ